MHITNFSDCETHDQKPEHQKYFWNVTTLQGKSQYGVRKLNSGIHGSLFVYNKKSVKVPFVKYFISLVAVLEFD